METLAKRYLDSWMNTYGHTGPPIGKIGFKNSGISVEMTKTRLLFYRFKDGSLINVYSVGDNKTGYQHYDNKEQFFSANP